MTICPFSSFPNPKYLLPLLLLLQQNSEPKSHYQFTTFSLPPKKTPFTMSVVIGNIAPFLDLVISPPRTIIPDRSKIRPLPSDVVLHLFKKDHQNFNSESFSFENKERHVNIRGKSGRSKVNEVEFENSSDDENGNGNGFEEEIVEDEGFDWEKEMKRRVKEIEEMRDLEKKAEELQYKVDKEYDINSEDGLDDNREDTEEEKRMRVRKELEKVNLFTLLNYNFLSVLVFD